LGDPTMQDAIDNFLPSDTQARLEQIAAKGGSV
jgi:hypothetical protein